MLKLTDLMTPYGDNPKQVKFTISERAHNRLRKASQMSGADMSVIIDTLIREHMELGDEPERKTFTVPDGHETVRDGAGRATGETRPISREKKGYSFDQ